MLYKFKPTYLYVKTHNITGLKYFGKTIQDPFKYKGSGKYWQRHIQKYGYDVNTHIIGYYTDENECTRIALEFSDKHHIVESKNWANLMPENGICGGLQHNSGENFKLLNSKPRPISQKRKISNSLKGIIHSPESNLKRAESNKGLNTGKPKPLIICRLSDRKEMSATGFSLYIRRLAK